MKLSGIGKALLATFGALSPKIAQDEKIKDRLALANTKSDKTAIKEAVLASDESMNPEQVDNIVDAILGVEQSPMPMEPMQKDMYPMQKDMAPMQAPNTPSMMPVKDAGNSAVMDYLASCGLTPEQMAKVGELMQPAMSNDEDNEDEEMGKEKMQAAMDSMKVELMQTLRAAEDARKDVAPVVGHVAMDSADDIYKFALDHLGVNTEGISGTALKRMFDLAKRNDAPVIAQDSNSNNEWFAALKTNRIRNA